MKNEEKLTNYNIQQDSIIHLLLRLKGGILVTQHHEGVPFDVILTRVIPGGDEIDFASFYTGQLLTDTAINAAAQQILNDGNVDHRLRCYLPVGAMAIFGVDENTDSLPANLNIQRSQLFNVQHYNNHWILHHVDFENKKMRVFDSLQGSIPNIKIQQHQNQLAKMFQRRYRIETNTWKYCRPTNVPQQIDSYSCGDFCLAYMQELLRGELGTIGSLNPHEVPKRRPNIAMGLLRNDVNGRAMLDATPTATPENRTNSMLAIFHRRQQLRSAQNSLKILIDENNGDIILQNSSDLRDALEATIRNISTSVTNLPPGQYYIQSGQSG